MVNKRKYTQDYLISLYQKHNGNYKAIGRELSLVNVAVLFKRYALADEYPGIGHKQFSYNKEDLIDLYVECKGNYCEIGRRLNIKQPYNVYERYGLKDECPAVGNFTIIR